MPVPTPTPAPVELTAEQAAQVDALVETRVNLRFQEMVDREQRKTHILEFTRAATGKGLPVQGEELSAFLSSLTPEQLATAEGLFTKCASGPIDFSEHGHGRTVTGGQPLPEPIAANLKAWLAAGQPLAEFFAINAVELGAMADYNLAEFQPKEQ